MSGKHLAKKFTKVFIAKKEDTIAPSINDWIINSPHANTLQPFTVSFKESIDHISASTYLVITDGKGEKIKGNIVLKMNESIWEFTPLIRWRKGTYKLYINDRLEDIAANNLNGIFDHKQGSLKKL